MRGNVVSVAAFQLSEFSNAIAIWCSLSLYAKGSSSLHWKPAPSNEKVSSVPKAVGLM